MADDGERLNTIVGIVGTIVNLLVKGEFETVEALARGRGPTADGRRSVVEDYPFRLVTPPAAAWDDIEVEEDSDVEPATFDVTFRLWDEDGIADLWLELRLVERRPVRFEIEITGLHSL